MISIRDLQWKLAPLVALGMWFTYASPVQPPHVSDIRVPALGTPYGVQTQLPDPSALELYALPGLWRSGRAAILAPVCV